MAYLQGSFPLLARCELAPGVFSFTISCPEIAAQAQAGQFVHVRVEGFTLRRPISICSFDRAAGTVRIVFEVRGRGTERLSHCKTGEMLDLLGPLGNGFSAVKPGEKLIVVGGGIGVPPMLQAAKAAGADATAIIGFRTAGAVILKEEFEALGCDTRLATDDGSAGYHGFVTGLLKQRLAEGAAALICACGPMPMLKGVVALADEYGIPSEVSLEERMGCGIGACLVCACKTVKDGREIYSHVCKDGPVFNGNEVVF